MQGGGWGCSPDLSITVVCYARTGEAKDVKFNILFITPKPHLAFAWADQPSASGYTPTTYYSSNSAGGAIHITRSSVGAYVVTFDNFNTSLLDGGDVQVTAYAGGNAQCKVTSWSGTLGVFCFTPSGPVDSYFDVMFFS